MSKEQKKEAYKEYLDKWMQCEKCEKELLDLPISEAKKSGREGSLLFTTVIAERLKQKHEQLKELEAKKVAARQRFLETDN